ncbi:phosphotransferase [Chitinophaga cymbidii]|uniref:Aminoglycoside phosphotransferase domain-containing protein n=1 Tax=Chitinophaga cymbidii TaxID=1096750 RepID=A0A512RJK5_9BACT|nr:phosphotransferase [Chitinophaga cymbidii]GEP95887.1 hypothetical protein CCY01nite_21470 [Chitinophaga cymbidii]
MTNASAPPPYLVDLLTHSINKKPVHWAVPDCGLSSAHRFSVTFEDGSKVFVKAAVDALTAQWLRTEHLVLSSVRTAVMPDVVAWIDQPGTYPVLLSRDLSDAYWPASHSGVTWREGDFNRLFSSIRALSSCEAPPSLAALQNRQAPAWMEIANDPGGFLALGVCSPEWFRSSAGALAEAEMNADITGDCLVHGDIRSDNICIAGSTAMFVDWSHAARGSARYDLACVLPTLCLEGGPAPYLVMPDGGGEAALMCAGLVRRLIQDDAMPEWLKSVFRRLIAIELEWAAQCLGLDQPAG